MTTGKVQFAPDYKSEERNPLNVIFEQGMERQRVNAERARLERLVIEAAKAYGRAARAVEDYMKQANEADDDSRAGWQLLRDMESTQEELMLEAVWPLIDFESQQEK